MTREQLISRFATDWGFGPDITTLFETEVLRKACESNSPYIYLKNLIDFLKQGLIDIELKKENGKGS